MKIRKVIDAGELLKEPLRIRIINLWLKRGHLTTSDISVTTGEIVGKVNRHIQYFKRFDSVQMKKVDQWTIYELKPYWFRVFEQTWVTFDLNADPQLKRDLSNFDSAEKKKEVRPYRQRYQFEK